MRPARAASSRVAQSDSAAAIDWLRIETWKAYERPESEVTGNAADDYERRAPGTAGMESGVRYQFYATTDGFVLFMASEREFWKNFCEGIGRPDLFERWPGAQVRRSRARQHGAPRDPARDLRVEDVSGVARVRHGAQHADRAVNTPKTIADDPQFRDRMPWIPASQVGADMLPTPIKFVDETLPLPTMAPTVGEHTEQVLHDVLGWDDARIAAARDAGAFGKPAD